MKRIVTMSVAATTLICALAANAGITLYGQEGMRGRAFTFEESVPNLEGSRLNDRASSLSVRDGNWQVCSEPNFRGQCVTLSPGDYPTLQGTGLNNRISSAREIRVGGGGGTGAHRGVVLYDGPSFTGRSIRVDDVADSLERFNDRTRSMIVYDGEWELCEHDRFRGQCTVFRAGQHANLGYLTGELSSLRPIGRESGGAPSSGWGTGARAVLYEATDFRGRSIMVDDNLVDNLQGSGFNDRASSLRVERGYWVFCSDAHFQGQCRTFGPGDYPNLPPGLNDRISSGRRIHSDYPYDREANWSRGR